MAATTLWHCEAIRRKVKFPSLQLQVGFHSPTNWCRSFEESFRNSVSP